MVKDPRFNLQADKLTVYLGKGEERGLEHAIAEGNVGVRARGAGRERRAPDAFGRPEPSARSILRKMGTWN